ncbi:hypothetical protein OKW21_005168 [Catalinimonas alkaloidigena]|nr:hypothetical protein [Catalinimonas alkaloidigena]
MKYEIVFNYLQQIIQFTFVLVLTIASLDKNMKIKHSNIIFK